MEYYSQQSKEDLLALKSELEAKFEEKKACGLQLDMSRGKPSTSQLDISLGLLDVLTSKSGFSFSIT